MTFIPPKFSIALNIRPSIRLLHLSLVLACLGLLSSIVPSMQWLWESVLITFCCLALIDAWLLIRTPAAEFNRSIKSSLSLGVNEKVTINVTNNHKHNIELDVYDHFPEQAEVQGLPRKLLLDKNESAAFVYTVKPLQRGDLTFSAIESLLLSKYSLWKMKHLSVLENKIKVYPNYAPIIEYAMLSADNHLSMMGILKHRRRGQGLDFHQLREFRQGDSLKQIDWKASSRMRKIIAREYQDERDQQIIVMMDCGHRMTTHDGELSHFDHSLNALLLMSYVALRQGDSVGVSTFSSECNCWIKPLKGLQNIKKLLNGIYHLQPGSAAPDYSLGARNLIKQQRKRSLVLILTNLRDDDCDDLQSAVGLLKKYHKVVVASLQEKAIIEQLDKPVINLQDALTVAATHGYQLKRDQLVRQLRKRGVTTLDVLPENLALALTNTYLDLKTSGQI